MPAVDKWAQYEAPSAVSKPDKWARYESAPAPVASSTAPDLTSASPVAPPASYMDRLTEIQKPDPAHPWSYMEAVKALDNIGAGGLGMIRHPYDTAKAALAPLAAFLPSYTSGLRGIPIPVPNANAIPYTIKMMKDFANNPYGTIEGGIGQAAVLEAAPGIAEGARSVAEDTVRRVVGSGPGVASKLARAAAEDNRVIDLHNADKITNAQQNWQEAQAKATTDHQAELLRLRQKYAQDTRNALEKARTGTADDRAKYQSDQLAAKQTYDQSVRNQTQKFETDRAAAQKANADALRNYNQGIGKVAQQNRAATEAAQARTGQVARLQVGGSQLIYGLRQLDKALRDHAATMYDAIREKVGDATLPGTNLAVAARSALSKISGTSVTPTVFRDILSKYPEAEPETIEYQGAKIPRSNPLYDVLVQNGAVSSPPVTFTDLQGYYSELGLELSKGTLPADVYQASRALQDSIGDMMQKMADNAKVGDKFWDARTFYRKYMDTFHEPTGPSSSGSPVAQALLSKDPLVAADKFSGDSGDRGVADLRHYSDSLANLAQNVRQTAQTKISAPARGSVADLSRDKPVPVPAGANLSLPGVVDSAPSPRASKLPLPPVLPDAEQVPFRQPKLSPRRTISEGDLRYANEKAVQARAAGLAGHLFWWTGVWPAFRMLSELSRGAEISPRALALMPASGAAGMATEELMSQPAVVDFLTRATKQQVAKIPSDLRGSMPEIVAKAKSRGVQVSPILAAWAASIQRNQESKQGSQQQ